MICIRFLVVLIGVMLFHATSYAIPGSPPASALLGAAYDTEAELDALFAGKISDSSDIIKDSHLDFGTGGGQISIEDFSSSTSYGIVIINNGALQGLTGTAGYLIQLNGSGIPTAVNSINLDTLNLSAASKLQISSAQIDFDDMAGSAQVKTTNFFINTPQAKTYSNNDDDDETIGTDFTSSIVEVTGDNDSDNDSIDLQDGTSAYDGAYLSFQAVALVDADDTFTIDAETDSTCTGCPDSGIITLDAVGESVTFMWNHSLSSWVFIGRHQS